MDTLLYGRSGARYELADKPLGGGGEGAVHNILGKPDLVGKVYLPNKADAERERKLSAMVKSPVSEKDREMIAWPLDLLYDKNNRFMGFVMPKADATVNLNMIYAVGDSKYAGFRWQNKIIVAKNLCVVLSAVHRAGHICGDFNPNNICVKPNTGEIMLVDTDSYHVFDGATVHKCTVGMADYLAPELSNRITEKDTINSLPLPTFTRETDNFALAVHIFQLLMNGCHPFACASIQSDQSSSVAPQAMENIKKGVFPFINNTNGTTIPPFAPPLSSLPAKMQSMFRRAFLDGYANPHQRPSAEEWHSALNDLQGSLSQCNRDLSHQYYNKLPTCPLCEAEMRYKNLISNLIVQTKIVNQQYPPVPPSAPPSPPIVYQPQTQRPVQQQSQTNAAPKQRALIWTVSWAMVILASLYLLIQTMPIFDSLGLDGEKYILLLLFGPPILIGAISLVNFHVFDRSPNLSVIGASLGFWLSEMMLFYGYSPDAPQFMIVGPVLFIGLIGTIVGSWNIVKSKNMIYVAVAIIALTNLSIFWMYVSYG